MGCQCVAGHHAHTRSFTLGGNWESPGRWEETRELGRTHKNPRRTYKRVQTVTWAQEELWDSNATRTLDVRVNSSYPIHLLERSLRETESMEETKHGHRENVLNSSSGLNHGPWNCQTATLPTLLLCLPNLAHHRSFSVRALSWSDVRWIQSLS